MNFSLKIEEKSWPTEAHELRYALKNNGNFLISRTITHEESLWNLISAAFWVPTILLLVLFPLFLLPLWIVGMFMEISTFTSNVCALLLACASGIYVFVRKQTHLRDYRTRKQYVGTKTLQLDFKQKLLIAEEVFQYYPEKNRKGAVPFDNIKISIIWDKGVEDSDYPGFYTDYFTVYLWSRSGSKLKQIDWSDHWHGCSIFSGGYASTDTEQAASAQKQLDEVIGILKTQGLHA